MMMVMMMMILLKLYLDDIEVLHDDDILRRSAHVVTGWRVWVSLMGQPHFLGPY